MFLVGNVAFRLRMVGAIGYAKLTGAAALLTLFALGGALPALLITGAATFVLVALCVLETFERAV